MKLFDTTVINTPIKWQYPSLTEKQAFLNHENRNYLLENSLYVGCAWASIIDYIENTIVSLSTDDFWKNCEKSKEYLNCIFDSKILETINLEQCTTHTVCQHIHWYKLLGLWEHLNIKNLWISHQTNNKTSINNINIYPWPLIATNTEIPSRNTGLYTKDIKHKQYLCSFIGAHNQYYRSNIRLDIVKILKNLHQNNIYVELCEDWFYNDIVYNEQIKNKIISKDSKKNKTIQTIKYNTILSDSIFSLCPEGSGPNTLRIWESMSIGSIPVLFENDWVKPKISEYQWDDISITIQKNQIENIISILENIPEKQVRAMQNNCINAYRYFRNKTCF